MNLGRLRKFELESYTERELGKGEQYLGGVSAAGGAPRVGGLVRHRELDHVLLVLKAPPPLPRAPRGAETKGGRAVCVRGGGYCMQSGGQRSRREEAMSCKAGCLGAPRGRHR